MNDKVLELKDVSKAYPGVVALDHVSLDLKHGEVLALMGENGAGKSTLIKVIAGAIVPDSGAVCIGGKEYRQMTPQIAHSLGIEVIYQEFNLFPSLSIAENIFMGNFPGNGVTVDYRAMEESAGELFEKMNVRVDPRTKVRDLSVAYMQLVEIAKALSKNVKILIMDEPTAPLTAGEVDILLELVRNLKKQGVSVIYISHRLNEVFQIADRVVVLRDGHMISERDIQEVDRNTLVHDMVGRNVTETFPEHSRHPGEVVLSIKHLSGNGIQEVSFDLRRGEILGLAGLVGSGRTELVRMIYGADPHSGGEIFVEQQRLGIRKPKDAIDHGITLAPEDRKRQGVILGLPVFENISLPIIRKLCHLGVVDRRAEQKVVDRQTDRLRVKMPDARQPVKNLSGGNQQKIVLAKLLASDSRILILDEPTRGIDVGAKQEIYRIMNELCDGGMSIIMISSEMEEVIGMSDRILVMHEGKMAGMLDRKDFSQEKILSMAANI